MADGYWRYSDARQPPQLAVPPLVPKRPRNDYEVPSGRELSSYYARDDDRGALRGIRDIDSLGASYDRYLRSVQNSSYDGGQSARHMSGGIYSRPVDDLRIVGIGGADLRPTAKDRAFALEGGRPEVSLPPDASSTLFVEGLPSDCSRREVARILSLANGPMLVFITSFSTAFVPSLGLIDIFRPFVGYKEVRLVSKESRHHGGDPLILCFVDFLSPAHAATALDALQGYRFDEHDPDSVKLRLQFARYPGARSGGGHRGKR